MPGWLEEVVGGALQVVILLDVFLAVLYARIGSSVLGSRLARLIWWAFIKSTRPLAQRQKGKVLSFCGPTIIVLVVVAWALGLACGAGMIVHPKLGSSIQAASGKTPTDFLTALYIGGTSMSFVAGSDFAPKTSGLRLYFLLNAVIGLSVMTLTLTYLMQIYAALRERNELALTLHLQSRETGDAAELIAGLGPGGQFESGYNHLIGLAERFTAQKEAHHFYPVLFYFRFPDVFYSVSRSAIVALDLVTLVRSALPAERYRGLQSSAALDQLWRACLMLLRMLDHAFMSPRNGPDECDPIRAATRERWKRRFFTALEKLHNAGIPTVADERAGAERYIALRTEWQCQIAQLAPMLGYTAEEIDPAGHNPAAEIGSVAWH
jgi:hypothetical protein